MILEGDKDYNVALLTGIRRTGKTTLLKQILQHYREKAVYIDLTADGSSLELIQEKVDDNVCKILLLDEISYLKQYELISQALFDYRGSVSSREIKIIITGSSASHLVKLSGSKLGCRSRLFRLPPLTFTEYLYFTDKIPSYDKYDTVTAEDFAGYLMLKDLEKSPAVNLAITFDGDYFRSFYNEVMISNSKSQLTHSLTELGEDDLTNFVNILAS